MQRELAQLYFAGFTDSIKKADGIIQLLNHQDVQLQPQLVSILLDLAFKSLKESENALLAKTHRSPQYVTQPDNDPPTSVQSQNVIRLVFRKII